MAASWALTLIDCWHDSADWIAHLTKVAGEGSAQNQEGRTLCAPLSKSGYRPLGCTSYAAAGSSSRSLAWATIWANASGSRIARSASILRLMSAPASFRPWMSLL